MIHLYQFRKSVHYHHAEILAAAAVVIKVTVAADVHQAVAVDVVMAAELVVVAEVAATHQAVAVTELEETAAVVHVLLNQIVNNEPLKDPDSAMSAYPDLFLYTIKFEGECED